MRRQRRASSDIAEHPKPEEADLPAEEAGSPSAVTDPKPEEADLPAEEAGSPSDIAAPKPEEAVLPAEEAESPSAVTDPEPEEAALSAEEAGSPSAATAPKPEEAALPAEEVGSPSAATAPKPEEAALPVEEVGPPSAVADPKTEEADLPAEEAGSPSDIAERPEPEEADLPVEVAESPPDIAEHPKTEEADRPAEEAGSPPATAERLNRPPIETNVSVQSVPVGDWAYDVQEWAWATLSAMRRLAGDLAPDEPTSAPLTSAAIRLEMAVGLGLTPEQLNFTGGLNREREFVTRCTTMRLLLEESELLQQSSGEYRLTNEGATISQARFQERVQQQLESFDEPVRSTPMRLHRLYRGRHFPGETARSLQLEQEIAQRTWARLRVVRGSIRVGDLRQYLESAGDSRAFPQLSYARKRGGELESHYRERHIRQALSEEGYLVREPASIPESDSDLLSLTERGQKADWGEVWASITAHLNSASYSPRSQATTEDDVNPQRPRQHGGSSSRKWIYDRHLWGLATLAAIRRGISEERPFTSNSSVTYELARILDLPRYKAQIPSQFNPAEPEYKARCHTMRLHLKLAGFVEKRPDESGWRLTEQGQSATSQEVIDELDRVSRITPGELHDLDHAAGVGATDTTAFFYAGRSTLTDDGLTSVQKLRDELFDQSHRFQARDSIDDAPSLDSAAAGLGEQHRGDSEPEGAVRQTPDWSSVTSTTVQQQRTQTVPDSVSDEDFAEPVVEDEDEDGAEVDDDEWLVHANERGFPYDSVTWLACATMSVLKEADQDGYSYSTVQMINDRVGTLLNLEERTANGESPKRSWAQGSSLWLRLHLARMALAQGAGVIETAAGSGVDAVDPSATFAVVSGALDRTEDDVIAQVEKFWDRREVLKWQYDYRAWMWEVLSAFRACPIPPMARYPTGTLPDITHTLVARLPGMRDLDERIFSEFDKQRDEHVVRSHTALLYLEHLKLCERTSEQQGGHRIWALTDEGNDIRREDLYDRLAIFAETTLDDLASVGVGMDRQARLIAYRGNPALVDIERLKESSRFSDLDLCWEIIKELVDAEELELKKLWRRVGDRIRPSRPPGAKNDLPPWRRGGPKAKVPNLFAYRMMHATRALTTGPSPLLELRPKSGQPQTCFLTEDGQAIGKREDAEGAPDFGQHVSDYFERHDYETWRTENWMREFCNQLNALADGDGTLFELLMCRLLERMGGETFTVHHVGNDKELDQRGFDIVVRKREWQLAGRLGQVPIYTGAEDVWVVQCKHTQKLLPLDQTVKVYHSAVEFDNRAGGAYRVTTAILATLGDLEDAANEAAWWTGRPQIDAGQEEESEAGMADDDRLQFDVWDGGRILRLIAAHKVGVKNVRHDETQDDGDGDGELEVDVEYLRKLKEEAAALS